MVRKILDMNPRRENSHYLASRNSMDSNSRNEWSHLESNDTLQVPKRPYSGSTFMSFGDDSVFEESKYRPADLPAISNKRDSRVQSKLRNSLLSMYRSSIASSQYSPKRRDSLSNILVPGFPRHRIAPEPIETGFNQKQHEFEKALNTTGNGEDFVEENDDEPFFTRKMIIQLSIVVLIFIAIAIASWKLDLFHKAKPALQMLNEHRQIALPVLGLTIIILSVLCLPGISIPLTCVAMMLQPLWLAAIFNIVAVLCAAVIANFLGENILKKHIDHLVVKNKRAKIVKEIIETDGILMTVMLRLALPYSFGTYIFSTLKVDYPSYIIATVFCAALHTLPDTFMGSTVSDIINGDTSSTDNTLKYLLFLATMVIEIMLASTVAILARRSYRYIKLKNSVFSGTIEGSVFNYEARTPSLNRIPDSSVKKEFTRGEIVFLVVVYILCLACAAVGVYMIQFAKSIK